VLIEEPLGWLFDLEAACLRKNARSQLRLLDAVTAAIGATGMGASRESRSGYEKVRGELLKAAGNYGDANSK
jgi:hypothetical protein